MVGDRTHGKGKKHSLLRSHLPQREQQIPRDVSTRESLHIWENASLDRLNSIFGDNGRWLGVGTPFFLSLIKTRSLLNVGAKFSNERVCNYKGDQNLVSVDGFFFPLTANQFSTYKTDIYVVSECYNSENHNADALQGRWPQFRWIS